MQTSCIWMESTIVEVLSLPQFLFCLHIGNRLSCFVILDDPGCSIQGFFGSENILWKKSINFSCWKIWENFQSYKWISDEQKMFGAVDVGSLRKTRLINIYSFWQCHFLILERKRCLYNPLFSDCTINYFELLWPWIFLFYLNRGKIQG